MKRLLTGLVFASTFAVGAAWAEPAADVAPSFGILNGDEAAVDYSPTRVMVRFNPDATPEQMAAAHAAAKAVGVLINYTIVNNLQCVQVPEGTVLNAIKAYQGMPGVMYAEPDFIRWAFAQTSPGGIFQVNAPNVWALSGSNTRGQGAKVAVLDTGIDLTHPDLPTPILTSSFISGQTVQDGNNHGTHTAGTVAAVDNTIGVIGVAPSATLLIGKVLSNAGSGADSGIIQGIQWASTNGADVISMSLGGTGFSQSSSDANAAAVAAGTTVIAASGNAGTSVPNYPASYPSVIAVGAVSSTNTIASFSSFGPMISVVAPGVNVLSTIPVTGAQTASVTALGTSRQASWFTGSGTGNVSGVIYNCNVGNPADFPAAVSNNIAHIRRGGTSVATGSTLTFAEKVSNAIAAGARAVVISNNVTGVLTTGTLNGNVTIPVASISQADGDAIFAAAAQQGIVNIGSSTSSGYASYSGTSMACPHVAGVAALLYGKFGRANLTPALVRTALQNGATDLGTPGRDDTYGYGIVNALASVNYLNTVIRTCPADLVGPGGSGGPDGLLTADDVLAFIGAFFSNNLALADVATLGGTAGPDGALTVDDLVFFLNTFFGGCQ